MPSYRRRTIKDSAVAGTIDRETARRAVSAVARARAIKERLRAAGRTFPDSTELVRKDRGQID